jgi:crossover junction endodeoxyribonuclease RuvC
MIIVAGIDPGLDGGVAVLNETGDTLETAALPTMGDDTGRVIDCAQLARWLRDRDVTEVIIERAQAMRKPGGKPQGVGSVFRYGVGYGQLLGLLQGMLLPYTTVSPLVWKRHYSLLNNKRAGIFIAKDDSRRKAIELFPQHADQFKLKKDIHRAEAALLARYHIERG